MILKITFRSGIGREDVRGLVVVRDDASGATRTSGAKIQAQSGRSRGLDRRQGGDAHVPTLPTVQTKRPQGTEEEARGL